MTSTNYRIINLEINPINRLLNINQIMTDIAAKKRLINKPANTHLIVKFNTDPNGISMSVTTTSSGSNYLDSSP